jgi:hypothetical protein
MHGQVVFAALYAGGMALAALGLDRAGRAAAFRGPAPPGPAAEEPPWPHTGSVAVHTVVGMIAAVAGLLIAVVTGFRHHEVGDLALLAAPVSLAMIVLPRLHGRLRPPGPATRRQDC